MNKEEIISYLSKKKDESHKLHKKYINEKDENMCRFYSIKYNTLCEVLSYIEEN